MPKSDIQHHSLCAECHAHMCRVKKLVQECTGELDSKTFYGCILDEFKNLITISDLHHRPILQQYFNCMFKLSRYLFNRLSQGLNPHEHVLLLDGIKIGIRCCGIDTSFCPESQKEKIIAFNQHVENITKKNL